MISFFYDSYWTILNFFFPGVFLGFVYDFFRLCRIARNENILLGKKEIHRSKFSNVDMEPTKDDGNSKKKIFDAVLVFIEDIIFFIIVSVVEILTTYYVNNGEIRIYCLLSSYAGFMTYQKTIGIAIIFFSKKIVYLLNKALYCIICLILKPYFHIADILKKIIRTKKNSGKKNRLKS